MLKDILLKEIEHNRSSGTYLFYGEDTEKNLDIAYFFIKKLYTNNLKSEEEKILLEKRLDNNSYSDFFIFDKLSIDDVRNMKNIAALASYEGNKKVFLIKDIKNTRKEAANAMLKLIEEPSENNYFILISKDLQILPTIKSRSMIFNIPKDTMEELGVDKYVYDFFLGVSKDIMNFKEQNLILNYSVNLDEISNYIKHYEEIKEKKEENKKENIELIYKIKIYLVLREFISNIKYLKNYKKVKFAEDIFQAYKNKETLSIIITYITNLLKLHKDLVKFLEIKKMLNSPINYKNLLISILLAI